MSNTLLTPQMVTKAAVPLFVNSNAFLGNIDRQYSDQFAQTGAKIGNTLNIRIPSNYVVSDGPTLAVQDNTQTDTPLTLSNQRHVDIAFSSAEQALSLMDFSELILKPAMNQLAAHVAADVMSVSNTVPNMVANGLDFTGAGTLVSPNASTFNSARAQLAFNSSPMDNLSAVMDYETDVRTATSLQGLFNPTGRISEIFDNGEVKGPAVGIARWMADQAVQVTTSGTIGTMPTVNGANQTGTSIAVSGSLGTTLKVGDIITFEGVYAVNPLNYESTGKLRQFAVTSAYANGTTIDIYPALVPASYTSGLNTVQGATCTASPANGAVIYPGLPSATTYRRNLVYQKNAFTLATADLPIYGKGVVAAHRENYKGVSLRFLQSYDPTNDRLITRIDILYGYAGLRKTWAAIVPDVL